MLSPLPPDLSALLQLNAQVEPALQRRLNGILPAFIPRAGMTLPADRIDIAFAQNQWANRWLPDKHGVLRHATWSFTLTLAVHTAAVSEEAPAVADLHPQYCRQIRAVLAAAIVDPAFLPWHCIAELNEQSGTETVQTEEDTNVSALVFTGLLTVRSDAMAAV